MIKKIRYRYTQLHKVLMLKWESWFSPHMQHLSLWTCLQIQVPCSHLDGTVRIKIKGVGGIIKYKVDAHGPIPWGRKRDSHLKKDRVTLTCIPLPKMKKTKFFLKENKLYINIMKKGIFQPFLNHFQNALLEERGWRRPFRRQPHSMPIPWAKLWYNTTFHASSKTTPFQTVYGRSPPPIVSYD